MSHQLWIQSSARDVQKIKQWLGSNLNRGEKVKRDDSGHMLTPTIWRCDDENTETLCAEHMLPADLGVEGEVRLVILPISKQEDDVKGSVVEQVVRKWLRDTVPRGAQLSDYLALCPKRWSVYRPMLLLPAGSFQSAAWTSLLRRDDVNAEELWHLILAAVSLKDGGEALTHLAVNSGIPSSTSESSSSSSENFIRSPTGLVILYGDFGPACSRAQLGGSPTEEDFDDAFWVGTKQNGNYQTWAPRYTMFSRGNIKEKARVLAFHDEGTAKTIRRRARRNWEAGAAVDLYAGIGYFVFSYVGAGMQRVFCWEINPWSVEGLRRGAVGNGWKIRVVKGKELDCPVGDLDLEGVKIVIFEESNEYAGRRMEELKRLDSISGVDELHAASVVHVNCGLLPESEPSWETALRVLSRERGGWLHLHENVAKEDIEARSEEIGEKFRNWTKSSGTCVEVEHVELVKTFAPGVWHCVFDVYIGPIQA